MCRIMPSNHGDQVFTLGITKELQFKWWVFFSMLFFSLISQTPTDPGSGVSLACISPLGSWPNWQDSLRPSRKWKWRDWRKAINNRVSYKYFYFTKLSRVAFILREWMIIFCFVEIFWTNWYFTKKIIDIECNNSSNFMGFFFLPTNMKNDKCYPILIQHYSLRVFV